MSATRSTAAQRRDTELSGRERLLTLLPVLLALFFALWSLRGVGSISIAESDSPRHALNGAFLFDLVRHGKLAHPVEYGYWYYSRLPALSLPYHPPVFPAFEALIYSLVGVNSFGARLAVAIATAAAVLLLYRLVLRTHDSRALALIATTTFFALPRIQRLSNTIMLEVPALVFVIAALLNLVPDEEAFQSRRSLCFAFFAAAAIWTKQTVFLFLLPFVYVLVSGKWGLLRRAYFWVTTFLVGASGVALALLGRELNWNSINQSWAKMSVVQQVVLNWNYYFSWKVVVELAFVMLCLASYRLPGGRDDLRKDRIYIAWFISAILVLLVSPAYESRYLFFAFPPFLVLANNGLVRILRPVMPNYKWAIPVTVCCAVFVYGLRTEPVDLHGPAEAAILLHDAGHRRILFCGGSGNGAFIFAVRSVDPALTTIVVRGDKLTKGTFTPERLNSFIKQYGIDSVVLQRTSVTQAWDALSAQSLPFLSLERVLEMGDSDHRMDGSLSIYRVKDPTTVPESSLRVPISVLGRDVELRF